MTIERIKYTPGPWAVDDSFSHVGMPAVRAAGYEIVAEPNEALAECTANARLIAAAPDLLEACRSWIDWMDSPGDGTEKTHADEVAMFDAMRAAIAKATGEQP